MKKLLAMIMAVCMVAALLPAAAATETETETAESGEIVFDFATILRGEGDDGAYDKAWNVNGMFGSNYTTVKAESTSYAVKTTRTDLTIKNEKGEDERFLIADLGTGTWTGERGYYTKGVWTIEAYLGENAAPGYYEVAVRGTKMTSGGTFDIYVDGVYAGEYVCTANVKNWEFGGKEKLNTVYIIPDSNKKINISFKCTSKGYYTDMTTAYDYSRLSINSISLTSTNYVNDSNCVEVDFTTTLRGTGDDGVYGTSWNSRGLYGTNYTTVAAETASYSSNGTRSDLDVKNSDGKFEKFLQLDLGTSAWDGLDKNTGSNFKGVWTIEADLGENAKAGYYDVSIKGTAVPQGGIYDVYVDEDYAGVYSCKATVAGSTYGEVFVPEHLIGKVYITPDNNNKAKISFRCTERGASTLGSSDAYWQTRLLINSLKLTPSTVEHKDGIVTVDFSTALRSETDDGVYVGTVKWPVTGIFGANFETVAAKSSTFKNSGTRIDLSSKNDSGKYEKFLQLDLGRNPWSGDESDNLGRWTISVDMGKNAKSGYYKFLLSGTKMYSAGEFDVYADGVRVGRYSSNLMSVTPTWTYGGEKELGTAYITPDANGKVEITFAVTKNGYYNDLTSPYETARIALNTLTMELVSEAPGEKVSDTVSVYVDALAGGSVEKSTVDAISNVRTGTLVNVKAIADDGYVFSHWKDASEKFISNDAEYSFRPYVNTSAIAVFDKVSTTEGEEKEVVFFNGNGDYVATKTTTGNSISDIPRASLAGYVFDMWTIDGKTAFDGSNVVNAVTRVVAKYKDESKKYSGKVTFGTESQDVVYDKEVTFSDENAKVWKRNGKTVAYGTTYKHYIFDAATITAETENVEKVPVIAIDKHSSEDIYMIEYDIPEGFTKLETGILFGDSTHDTVSGCYYKAKSANKAENETHGQFTASKNDSGTYDQSVVRGYLIYTDGAVINVVYADMN